jgi:hypothetical protein
VAAVVAVTKTPKTPKAPIAFTMPRPSRRLAALTSSALALPGIAGSAGSASAESPVERASASASFSYYKEDNLSPGKFSDDGVGSRDRYEVYTEQIRLDLPVTERIDVGIDVLYEEMSGASPWYVTPDGSDTPLQVMSGATIDDERFDFAIDVDFFMDRGKDTISFGISDERDYFAVNAGIGAERNFNDKNTTLSAAFGFSKDYIDPTDSELFDTRPNTGEKYSIDLFAGFTQILTRASTMAFTVNYKYSDGYLADPYKAIRGIGPGDGLLSDVRPDTKEQVSLLLRYRHHVEALVASLHADYRFYADDFGVTSHTFDLSWYQNIWFWDRLTITPGFRYYSQSKADFYDPLLSANPGTGEFDRSSDFRLSPYGAMSWKVKADIELLDVASYNAPNWLQAIGVSDGLDLIGSLSYERYFSDGDFALVGVSESEEAPGLARFQVFALSLTGRF